jgi:hypothetical protein
MTTFLGSSSTFLSVLVTLIVLCILSNDSNFIHEILTDIKNKINIQIRSLKNESDFGSITSTNEYKLLQYYIKAENHADNDLYNEALNLDLKIRYQIATYQSNVSNDWMKPAQDTTDLISNSKEQMLSPLFALMIALVGFIAEEVVTTPNSQSLLNPVATFLTVFLTTSALFLVLLWVVFAWDVSLTGKEKSEKSLSSLAKVLHYRQTELYSYEYIFRNFFKLLILAVLVTALVALVVFLFDMENWPLFSYEHLQILRYSMLFLVVMAGLVLPFVGPYCGYRHVLSYAAGLNEKEKHDKEAVKQELIDQMNSICKKINCK